MMLRLTLLFAVVALAAGLRYDCSYEGAFMEQWLVLKHFNPNCKDEIGALRSSLEVSLSASSVDILPFLFNYFTEKQKMLRSKCSMQTDIT